MLIDEIELSCLVGKIEVLADSGAICFAIPTCEVRSDGAVLLADMIGPHATRTRSPFKIDLLCQKETFLHATPQ